MGKGRPIRPGHVSGGGHAGRPTCEPVRSGASDPPDRSGRSAGSGDAVVRPGAGAWSPACTWKQGEAHGTHRKVQDDAGSGRRQPHPGGDASSAVVLVEAAGRLLPNAPPPWRARGRYHRPGPSSRATAPCRPRIRFGGTCRKAAAGSALSNKYRMQAAVRSKLPHRPMHRRAAPPSAGAVTQRSGSTWSIRSGGLPPAGAGVS